MSTSDPFERLWLVLARDAPEAERTLARARTADLPAGTWASLGPVLAAGSDRLRDLLDALDHDDPVTLGRYAALTALAGDDGWWGGHRDVLEHLSALPEAPQETLWRAHERGDYLTPGPAHTYITERGSLSAFDEEGTERTLFATPQEAVEWLLALARRAPEEP
ncbi:MAG: hypothetical protein JNJ54_06415 [Myxococcaceae bacterium]|nr:hypothetical protein [Myxococcaceae bacterium]